MAATQAVYTTAAGTPAAPPLPAPALSQPVAKPVAGPAPLAAPVTVAAPAAVAEPQPSLSKNAALPPKKPLSKLPSLKDIGKPVAEAAADVAVMEEEAPAGTYVPLQPEALQRVWHEITQRKRAENMLEYTLLNRPYQVSEQNEILLQVENQLQVDQLNALRPALLTELRQRLNNRSIRLAVEMKAANEGQKMLYTTQDKFNHLVEKYPLLNELRQRLGLDMDF